MATLLSDSLAQLVRLQREQIQQSQRANIDQKQQFSSLSRTLTQVAAPKKASDFESGFIQSNARRQARSFDKEMRRVIIDLGKQWQHFGRSGKINIERLGQSLVRLLQRLIRQNTAFSSLAVPSSVGRGIDAVLSGIFHRGGVVGDHTANTPLPATLFHHRRRLHQGGKLGLGIGPAEYPAILQRGETVLPASSTAAVVAAPRVEVNIHRAPIAARTAQKQNPDGSLEIDIIFDHFEDQMGHRMSRGEGLASVMENRYGLNPMPLS